MYIYVEILQRRAVHDATRGTALLCQTQDHPQAKSRAERDGYSVMATAAPPCAGDGLLQLRWRVRVPAPHVEEQPL